MMKLLKLTLMDLSLIQQMHNSKVDWNHARKMLKQHKWEVLVWVAWEWEELEVDLVECLEAQKLKPN